MCCNIYFMNYAKYFSISYNFQHMSNNISDKNGIFQEATKNN